MDTGSYFTINFNKYVAIMWKSWRGNILIGRTRKAASEGIKRAAEATLEVSLNQVPLDEGTLSESGIVMQNPSNDLEQVISFGGGPGTGFPEVPYAVKWHETPANFQHGRKHNYLRDPIKNFAPGAVKRELEKAMRKVW